MNPRIQLRATDLDIGYRGHVVGRNISLTIAPGEVLCLLGPNGAGKTTLFRTLLGLQRPLGGSVQVDGRPLERLRPLEIARCMAYVPQAHVTEFSYSVLDVVLMGRTARLDAFASPGLADRRIALQRLDELGIAALAEADYTRISGGQRQLALIARALAQDAPILVLDEPTASLDFGNQTMVLEKIRDLAAAGYGVVLSTHDPDHALLVANCVVVIADGGLRAVGPPQDVVTGPMLSAIYRTDVLVEETVSGRRVCLPAWGSAGQNSSRREMARLTGR
ncbi:MAG TPA: ABC transporter ATP-binding protein [Xanthobacteraceae bacterium]|nr:ABC transporter ATP-binding protein [Xanthobacteraceae bacterium]